MPRKRNNQNQPETPNVSPLFDDALPLSLRHKGITAKNQQNINLHTDSKGELSPYVIHLSHNEPVVTREAVSPNLDALADSLVFDTDLPEEEVGTAESLLVEFDDLVEQLREPELQTSNVTIESTAEETSFTLEEPVASTDLLQAAQIRDAVIDERVPVAHQETPELIEMHDELPEVETEEDKLSFFERFQFSFSFGGPRVRAIASFVAMSFALVLPLHAIQQVNETKATEAALTDVGKEAIDNFLRGTSALENDRFDIAGIDFARASENFSEAEASLNNLNAAVATVVSIIPQTDRTFDSVTGLVTAGKELSEAASTLAAAADDLQQKESLTITTKLHLLNSYVENAEPHVIAAAEALEKVDPTVIPAEYQETVANLKEKAPALANSMAEYQEFSDTLITIMGADRKMRYLVVFQNNTELRPTGGFPGSFAEIDVLNGEIVNITIPGGGTYDVQGQLSEFIEAPRPLSLINPRWEFHDANWFPDFPTSARKMLWFYENAGGPTVDGVLAINATLMPELLNITGPIDMPEYGRTIDSENFLFETQKIVEFEYEQYTDPNSSREEDAPKQFIGDLAPILLEKMTDADMPTTLTMMDLLGEGLAEKDVLMFFENNALQSNIESLGWSGSLKQTDGDYLMVVNTNLGGGKTDTVINQDIDMYSKVDEDGSILNTVTITKEHRGLQNALFESANNVDYIRLYVPKGTELISATGFEIPDDSLFDTSEVPLYPDEDLALIVTNESTHSESKTDIWDENGKTVFGNWIQTKPGEIETIEFTYKLPFKLESTYQETTLFDVAKNKLGFKDLETHTILIQKQPGVIYRNTNISVSYPDQKDVVWSSHEGTGPSANIEVTNERDHLVRFLIENALN